MRENARTIVQALDVVNTFVQDSARQLDLFKAAISHLEQVIQMLSLKERAARDDLTASLLRDVALCRARNECASLNPNHFLRPDGDAEPVPFLRARSSGRGTFSLSDFICQSWQKHFAHTVLKFCFPGSAWQTESHFPDFSSYEMFLFLNT